MDELRDRLEWASAGTYEFQRELGGGGMSRTYLTLERALDRRVVVKVLAPELLAGISAERFRREVLLAAQLQHPHVVPVLAAGDADGFPWFSMPYVDGDSLRQCPCARQAVEIRDIRGRSSTVLWRCVRPAGDAHRPTATATRAAPAARSSTPAATAIEASRRISVPATLTLPRAAGTNPMIALHSVDLPMPLRPTTPSTPSRASTSRPAARAHARSRRAGPGPRVPARRRPAQPRRSPR